MEIKSVPLRDLPPAVKGARQKLDAAQQALDAAEQELIEQNAIRHSLKRMADAVETAARFLNNDKTRLANAQTSVANFAADFEHRHANEQRHGWGIVVTRIYDAVIAEKLLEVLPTAIEQGEAELAELKSQLAEMKKRCGV
jgi:ABC-type Zn2+ transport system substrate-binding protein/surface adhesin